MHRRLAALLPMNAGHARVHGGLGVAGALKPPVLIFIHANEPCEAGGWGKALGLQAASRRGHGLRGRITQEHGQASFVLAGQRDGRRRDGWETVGWMGDSGMNGRWWDGCEMVGWLGDGRMDGRQWDGCEMVGWLGDSGMDGRQRDGWETVGWMGDGGMNGRWWDGCEMVGWLGDGGMGARWQQADIGKSPQQWGGPAVSTLQSLTPRSAAARGQWATRGPQPCCTGHGGPQSSFIVVPSI